MKKIYFYLILVYSVNFYANDTTTVVSLKNRNLREEANIDSKILSEIKSFENRESKKIKTYRISRLCNFRRRKN